ncbi:MAG: hypothetical protein N2662_02165 [Bacteroidales bacterium]|nr:hypothetical protein [Bacteroidales bacterium]
MLLFFYPFFVSNAQNEVVVRPKSKTNIRPVPVGKSYANAKPLTPQEQYEMAKARHLALQDEKTRMRILKDIKMTNDYYNKQKESKFVKWVKKQMFNLKRKGIL